MSHATTTLDRPTGDALTAAGWNCSPNAPASSQSPILRVGC
jgi:hypothetical protein